jgi:putative component of membrane protein insertase Oxa1/YidC/SpoIIIJ protein YidD
VVIIPFTEKNCPCTFRTCAKYKSAVVNHRIDDGIGVTVAKAGRCHPHAQAPLILPEESIPFTEKNCPCTFRTYAKYKSAVVNHRIDDGSPRTACLRRLNYSLLRWLTAADLYFAQVQKVHG